MIAQRVSGSHLSERASDVKTLEGRAISMQVGSMGLSRRQKEKRKEKKRTLQSETVLLGPG
jgi:hypothetical protein